MEAAEEPRTTPSQEAGEAGSRGPRVPDLQEPGTRALIVLLARQLVKNLVALVVPVGLISAALVAGTGPMRVFPRAWNITRGRRLRTSVLLTAAMVGFPVALGAGLAWAASLFTGIDHHAARLVAATVTVVLTAVVQGTALAVVALEQRRPPARAPEAGSGDLVGDVHAIDLDAVADRLSAHHPTRTAGRRHCR
jgi:hypothetical protein